MTKLASRPIVHFRTFSPERRIYPERPKLNPIMWPVLIHHNNSHSPLHGVY